MNSGLIGGIIGGIVGVLGGILGTYFSLRNKKGPRERAFMKKVAVLVWVAVTGFILASLAVPAPYRHFLLIPYMAALALTIVWGNRRQIAIRKEEGLLADSVGTNGR